MPQTAEAWRESFPEIPWDEPLVITIVLDAKQSVNVLACRFCIADIGIKAQEIIQGDPDVAAWFHPDDFIEHMATVHGG